ncbi:brain acid soluble protein 1 homolog [Procambarus clarkii]|uniref:brain acid soluble protein 1 homolog n=1 Tax=Procambarus clarkii TaxID=6728 RepID=UPI003743D646
MALKKRPLIVGTVTPPASGAPEEPTTGGPKAGAARSRRIVASTARGKKPLPRPETGNGEGSDTAGGRQHSSTREVSSTDDRAGAGEEALGSEETTEGDEVNEAKAEGRGEGSPTTTPTALGNRRSPAGEASTTPTVASKAPMESTSRGCTSATTERRRSEAGVSRSTELTGGADIPGPDKAGPDGTSTETVAGTTPGTRTERGSAEETPRSDKQGKSPSRKTKGASARRASWPAATWPSAPHWKQVLVWP